MDQVTDVCARDDDRLDRIVSALTNGVILVDVNGQVAWIDAKTRRFVNGGLHDLGLAVAPDRNAVDCFISPVDITINGEHTTVCLIQENVETKDLERNLVAAIQAAMIDTASFARSVLEKLRAMQRGHQDADASEAIDALSDREREVLGLICQGTGDMEISRMLQLSPNTVRNHIASLYRKIGVNRRGAAIIWARERGITGLAGISARRRHALNGHSAQ
jgi:DNA-binding CsgD family transcriptional regulator